MTRTRTIWAVLAGIYAIFFSWYTSFGGPLSEAEVDHYIGIMASQEPPPSPERVAVLRRFLEEDTGDDFVMVNVIDMYETPLQIEGVEPGESSDDVMAKYMEYMYPALFSRASHPVLFGQAANTAMDLMNADGMESWTTGAGMRYRSRRDLMDIATNPAFQGSHEFKVRPWRRPSRSRSIPGSSWATRVSCSVCCSPSSACALSWREASRAASSA